MRPAIAIFCVIVAGVILAAMLSLHTPRPDPLPDDIIQAREQAKNPPPTATPEAKVDPETQFEKYKDGAIRATLEIKDRGVLEMELYPKAAPQTVAHLIALSKKNFWDGIKVHREEPAVVQMGDPMSKGMNVGEFDLKNIGSHGSDLGTVPLEVQPKLPNVQYSVGLARADDPNSGDSQFYINKQDNPRFDFNYCVFGRVVKGTNLVDQIKKGDVIKHLQIYDAVPNK